jgi:hypothetical protein
MAVKAVPRNCVTAGPSVLRQAHGYDYSRRFEYRIASCPAQTVRKYSHNVTIVEIQTYNYLEKYQAQLRRE